MKTVHLGAASAAPARAAASAIASRREKLDRWGASLRNARASRPPKLPALPRFAPVTMPSAPAVAGAAAAPAVRRTAAAVRPAATHAPAAAKKTAAPAAAPTVTYVQPPPIIQYQQAPSTTPAPSGWSDDEGESDDSIEQGNDSGTEADG